MSRYRYILRRVVALFALLLTAACNVTRSLPEGEYLLSKVTINEDKQTPREERITVDNDAIDTYVRQSPNKKILGVDFYVWVYERANPDKQNWWNDFKRKIGEEPVLLDMDLTEKSVQNLRTYLQTRGYFSSEVTYEVDTTRRTRRAEVTYTIHQGTPLRIDTLQYSIIDKSLEPLIIADTANCILRRGDIMDITRLDAERERIAALLNNRGYFDFTVNNISYEVDTLAGNNSAGVKMIVRPTLAGYNERGVPRWEENAVYRISRINVFPTYDPMLRSTNGFKADAVIDTTSYYGLNIIRDVNSTPQLRNAVLRRTIPIYPSYIYNSSQVEHTYEELMSLGFFRNAKVAFSRLDRENNYVTYVGEDAGDEDALLNTREEFLECNIYCTPALKQSMKV